MNNLLVDASRSSTRRPAVIADEVEEFVLVTAVRLRYATDSG
jgi:hypothetical protein